MLFTLGRIIELLIAYKYYIIFPIAVVEGPIISILSGFIASNGYINIYIAFALLVLADLVGDTIFYLAGRFGGNPFLRHWGRFFGIRETTLLKLEGHFAKHGGKLLLFGKTQAIGGAILATAGVSKMSFPRFLKFNAIGTFVKTPIFLAIGYFFGMAYIKIDNYLIKATIILSLVIVVFIIAYILRKCEKI